MSAETWRPIPGWEGYYEASTLGRVRSLDREAPRSDGRTCRFKGRVLTPGYSNGGYPQVHLVNGPLTRRGKVHQLVAETFLGQRPEGMATCHNDGDPQNNSLENLRYDTNRENALDRVRHGRNHFANQTHCKRGHEFTEENTYRTKKGRECRACKRARDAARPTP